VVTLDENRGDSAAPATPDPPPDGSPAIEDDSHTTLWTHRDRATELASYPIQWKRYRRTLRFAAWLFARVIAWELVLRRVIGRDRVARGRAERLRRWAREFRQMATSMGGVMIKLGQFISSRVDILPPEVIHELASLQDEVPTVPFAQIRQTLVAELGPPEDRFASFDATPVAAASLGQAHRARLPNGERVVVKVQRPGIHSLVATDLKALAVIAGWAMRIPFIARRANVPALLDEFSTVLLEELDYTHEADNAEHFARMFATNKGIYIPRVYRVYSTRRVVTLEDVTAIKITDYDRIEAAGIDRRDVARRLISTYLWMVFIQRYYHADPHPGNLFVYPLDPDSPTHSGTHPDGRPLAGRPFYLIFVDFGMAGRLTPEIEAGLRETLYALTARDARRLVESRVVPAARRVAARRRPGSHRSRSANRFRPRVGHEHVGDQLNAVSGYGRVRERVPRSDLFPTVPGSAGFSGVRSLARDRPICPPAYGGRRPRSSRAAAAQVHVV